MPLTQFQQLIFDDLKANGSSTAKAIATRIKRYKAPVEFHLYRMETSRIVQRDGNGNWRLTPEYT